MESTIRVLAWGTYDLGKPRTRILLRGMKENDIQLIECHADVWADVEDKSQIQPGLSRWGFLFNWLFSYPGLILRFLRTPKVDVVFIGYLGQLDVLFIWLFAKLRNTPVAWDAHLSLYSTVVEDRQLISQRHILARILYVGEWLACRAADLILLDTETHVEYFVDKYHASPHKFGAVLVGVEPEFFPPILTPPTSPEEQRPFSVLFFGQFIPLHGIETMIQAAQQMQDDGFHWTIIGRGQVEEQIKAMLEITPVPSLEWIPWVNHEEIASWIHRADVCLGIFGSSDKAGRVIPNKVFEILSCGAPLITRDSRAIRELIHPPIEGIYLVPPSDPDALIHALISARAELRQQGITLPRFDQIRRQIYPKAIGEALVDLLKEPILEQPKSVERTS
jgi:glycosyltransferase involved in cell wall biosynthesis